jgi:hypothetical protein
MHHKAPSAVVGIALVAGTTLAAAAETTRSGALNAPAPAVQSNSAASERLNLTPGQKQKIVHGLSAERTQLRPSDFKPSVGATVPSAVSLSPVPLAISNDIPETINFSFAKLQDVEIVLVDPKVRRIAEVIGAPPS